MQQTDADVLGDALQPLCEAHRAAREAQEFQPDTRSKLSVAATALGAASRAHGGST